jgi:hypothetical protein
MSGYAHDEASQPKYHIERLANSTVAHVVMKAAVAKTHGIAQVEVTSWGRAVTVALVGGVQRAQRVEQGHHGASVTEDGTQTGEGPLGGPQETEQPRDDEDTGVVDQAYRSLDGRVRHVLPL